MSIIALIPARANSKGIPGKNLKRLGDRNLIEIAVMCALAAKCDEIWVNCTMPLYHQLSPVLWEIARHWPRPLSLDADDTPMFAVIDEMRRGGCFVGDDDALVLLQPTAPFRKPEHITEAVRLLRDTDADSVVSVVPLPLTHSPDVVMWIDPNNGGSGYHMLGWLGACTMEGPRLPTITRRQDVRPAFIRDGTVYAFYRKTVAQYGNIYGQDVRPLLIDPADSCELDTEADWQAVEQRWSAR